MTDVEQTIALLERTPAALDALLRDLPDAWTFRNEGTKPGTRSRWSGIWCIWSAGIGCSG
jgi:hypothetical protein